MRQLTYAMRFTGQAVPANDAGTVLKASTTSPSSTITSTVGDGLTGTIAPTQGGNAHFTSQVVFTSQSTFTESGTITFGEGNRLEFSSIGEGHLGPSADGSLQHGAVMWRIDGGEGQFEAASGLITSNFFVDGDGGVTDHQFGVLFVE